MKIESFIHLVHFFVCLGLGFCLGQVAGGRGSGGGAGGGGGGKGLGVKEESVGEGAYIGGEGGCGFYV